MKTRASVSFLVVLGMQSLHAAPVSPSSLKTKIYKMAMSTSELCTDPVVIYTNESPTETDFSDLPTIGSGAIAPGTYKCVMLEISDTFKYTPAENDGDQCIAGTEVTKAVCGADTPIKLIESTTLGSCTAGEDRMPVYISTLSTLDGTDTAWDAAGCDGDTDCNGSLPPTVAIPTRGTKLSAPIVISEDTTGTFVIDLTDALQTESGICSFENVKFAYR